MSFFSLTFLLFLIIIFICYYALPVRFRSAFLLLASYVFYGSFSKKYVLILLAVTGISYGIARLLEKTKKKKLLVLSVGSILFILGLFKFWNLWGLGLQRIFGISDISTGGIISLIAPVGLSFFTLEAIGYIVDVYKGNTVAEHNFISYGLFLSFFPKVLSGPIERSNNLLKQIQTNAFATFQYDKVKHGLYLMLWGYFLKIFIANRLAIMVDVAFSSYNEQTGFAMLLAVVLYGIQLYADFAGYSSLAIGIGETFGFSLLCNFRQPYFAQSIKDFWGRWHMSLSGWLKDYIYIPLGGNRKGKIRQFVNLIITFLVSGIWHGTGLQFVIWGLLHGIFQIFERALAPLGNWVMEKTKMQKDNFSFRFMKAIITFAFVDFSWLFFRASTATEAFAILKNIISNRMIWQTMENQSYLFGYDLQKFQFVLLCVLVMFFVDLLHENKVSISEWLNKQGKAFRWILSIVVGILLIMNVIRDYGLDVTSFIYTRF